SQLNLPMQLDLPPELQPIDRLPIDLPSGMIHLPLCKPKFSKWPGKPLAFTFGQKALIDFEGQPLFAELVILRLLEKRGWEGVWVSSYGGRFLREMPTDPALSNHVRLSESRTKILDHISPKKSGCFDVFAWHDDQILFCESKRRRRSTRSFS